jgi:hypothetical protein
MDPKKKQFPLLYGWWSTSELYEETLVVEQVLEAGEQILSDTTDGGAVNSPIELPGSSSRQSATPL